MAGRTPRQDRAPGGADPYADAFAGAAERYGVPEEYLRKVAFLESSGDPNARRGSSRGLMQFQPAAAREVGLKNPYDPVSSIYGAARRAAGDHAYLTGRLGRDSEWGEVYFAHQQGRYGAAKILENPDRAAAAVLAEFHKNPTGVITANGGDRSMDCKDLSALWIQKYNEAPQLGKTQNNIRVDPDFAAVARGETPPGAMSGYSDGKPADTIAPGNTAMVAREVFGPSTLGESYHAAGHFNEASRHTPGREQQTREAAARQDPDAQIPERGNAINLTETFRYHGFGDKTEPPEKAPEQPSGMQSPSAQPASAKQQTMPESPAPAFKRDLFTPMGNG